MRKALAAGAAFLAASAMAMGAAGAAPAEKVTICHGTASETNPYVEITVNANSFKDGHFDDGSDKSHGDNNHPDFILVSGSCSDGPGGPGSGTPA